MNIDTTQHPFYTPEKFQLDIKAKVFKQQISYLDAIMEFCKEKNVDAEDVLPLMTPYLKSKLYIDGMNTGILKREPTVEALFDGT